MTAPVVSLDEYRASRRVIPLRPLVEQAKKELAELGIEPPTLEDRLFNAADPGCELCGGMGVYANQPCPCTGGGVA